MADPLQDAIAALNTTLRAMTGIVKWHDDPPESLNEFPCGVAYADVGEMTVQGDWCRGLHTVRVNIYQNRQVLPTAVNAAKVWPYRVKDALQADQTLGGKVAAIVWPLRYRCLPLQYGDLVHYGVSFEIVLKIHAG